MLFLCNDRDFWKQHFQQNSNNKKKNPKVLLNTETALKSSVLRWPLILENDHWNTKWNTIYMALFLCTDFLEIKKNII